MQKISDIDAKITELSMPPDEKIAAAQAKLDSLKQQAKDLQAQRNRSAEPAKPSSSSKS